MTMKMRYTVLGCGSSPGTPRITGDWGACDPNEPRNRRLRCSLLIQKIGTDGTTNVVVDTSPDFREQMISADVSHIDGVLYTHAHADHIHGIDDLRGYALAQRKLIDIYADNSTLGRLHEAFGYCFKTPPGSIYPPILNAHKISVGQQVTITGKGGAIIALPVLQTHGDFHSVGFRFGSLEHGGLCYSPDISGIPDESLDAVKNLDCWIVDALQYKPHPSHFSLGETLEWIKRLKPKRSIITHMHIPLDYLTMKAELPEGVEPAYDGLVIEMDTQP